MNSFTTTFDSAARSKFPNNNASQFSLPFEMEPTKDLTVRVTNFTYPKEVLLDTEHLCTSHRDLSQNRILNATKPTKIFLRSTPTLKDVLKYIQENFKKLLKLTWNKTECTWKVIHSNYIIVLSNPLCHAVQLWQDVLTPWDKMATNCSTVDYEQQLPSDQFLIFVPISYKHDTYELKGKHEAFSCNKLLIAFNEHIDVDYEEKVLRVSKPKESELYIFSEALHTLLPFNQAGTCTNSLRRYWDGQCQIDITKPWELNVYKLSDMDSYLNPYAIAHSETSFAKSIRRPCFSHDNESFLSLIQPLFENDNYISLRHDNHVIIQMTDMTHMLVLGEDLKDILGFDRTHLVAPNTYVSKRPISVGFHHLFVYCSLVDYTTVAHTEERILLSLPFKSKFINHPIHIPIKCEKIKQISFSIRNEKGELISFPHKSSTRLQLEFQK